MVIFYVSFLFVNSVSFKLNCLNKALTVISIIYISLIYIGKYFELIFKIDFRIIYLRNIIFSFGNNFRICQKLLVLHGRFFLDLDS